jgi:hypothetical protein
MQVFNALTQQKEDVKWEVDQYGELICRFEDGGFLKFPPGISKEELQKQVDAHEEANTGQEVITPEMEAKRLEEQTAAEALVNELNGVKDVQEEAKK